MYRFTFFIVALGIQRDAVLPIAQNTGVDEMIISTICTKCLKDAVFSTHYINDR